MTRTRLRTWIAAGGAALTAVGTAVSFDRTRAVAIAVPIAAVLALGLAVHPAAFVLLYLGLRPLVDAAVYVQAGGLTLGTLWGAGLIVSLGVYWLVRGIRPPVIGRSWLIPLGFALAYVLATLWRLGLSSGDLSSAISNCVKIASFVLVALTCEQIASSAHGQRMIVRAGILMAVLSVVVIGIAISRNEYGIAYYTTRVRQSLGQSPHGYASLAVLSSTFVWIAAMRYRPRWPGIVLAGLLGVSVALSFVRTTFLAFVLVAAWFLVWSARTRRVTAALSALAVVASVAGILYAFRDVVARRLADLNFLSSGGEAPLLAGSGRVGIWDAVLHSATSSRAAFLLGQGSAASSRVTMAVADGAWSHNDYLEFLITGGVGVLILYTATVVWLLVSMRRLARDTRQSNAAREVASLMTAAVAAYALMAFFNGIIFYAASLAMAMAVGLARGMYRTPGDTFLDEPTEGGGS